MASKMTYSPAASVPGAPLVLGKYIRNYRDAVITFLLQRDRSR
jgi:hypothetical protein